MTPAWFARAACKDEPSELFWAPKGSPGFSDALRICGECPVASECAAAGRRRHEFGRWGSHYRPGATDEVFVPQPRVAQSRVCVRCFQRFVAAPHTKDRVCDACAGARARGRRRRRARRELEDEVTMFEASVAGAVGAWEDLRRREQDRARELGVSA